MRRRYPTDLTDAEWKCIEPYIRSANKRGRPKIHSLRRVLDAVFYVLRRWVVERTFAWLGQNRRMSKDYERLCATAEAFVYAAMSRLMVRRLARA